MIKKSIILSFICYQVISSSIFASEIDASTISNDISTEELADILEEAIDNQSTSKIEDIKRSSRAVDIFALVLRESVENENISTVREILRHQVGINSFQLANAHDQKYPLLCYAAQKTNLALFRLLIDIGREYIDDIDEFGDTPLILAAATYASQDSYEIIKTLIEMDADTEVRGEHNFTALKSAYSTFTHTRGNTNLQREIMSLLVLNSNISDYQYYDDNFLDNLLEFGLSNLARSKINDEKRKRRKRKYYNDNHNDQENYDPDYGPDSDSDSDDNSNSRSSGSSLRNNKSQGRTRRKKTRLLRLRILQSFLPRK